MKIRRCFFGINVVNEIAESAQHFQYWYQQKLGETPTRFTPLENLHVTLRFLGNTNSAQLSQLIALTHENHKHQAFTLIPQYFEYFPSRHPRTIIITIEPSKALYELASCLEALAQSVGFTPEIRSFFPHITIVQKISQPSIDLAQAPIILPKLINVTGFYLYESELSDKGSHYSLLGHFSL